MNMSHVMVFLTVSSFMMGVVSFLPAVVRNLRERYAGRFTGKTRAIDQLFVQFKASYVMGGAVVVGILLGALTGSWVLAIFCALLGLGAPKLVTTIWTNMRIAQFDQQLMDALILIANALRSGLDIATGIELVTTNTKPPISEEFGLVLNSYRLGGSLESALMDMTRRIHSRTLETVVLSIIIQRETGGNLIKTFEQLIQTIREENKLQNKVRAISAQGRTQVAFLAVFPWLLAGMLYTISPETIQPVLAQPIGQMAIAGLVVWEIVGIFITKKIVTVDV